MNLQTQIRRQQSTVQMLEKLVGAKRADQATLDAARRRLTDLQQQVDFVPISPQPRPDRPTSAPPAEPAPGGRILEGDDYISLQAELATQADQLNRKMAGLSNQLHQVPPGVACPELVRPILDLKSQIEAIWDKKRYLERNRCLPEEPAEPADDQPDRGPVPSEANQFELAYHKRRLIDQRSKLKRKLEDPKAKASKRHEWETELVKVNLQIQEIEVKLG